MIGMGSKSKIPQGNEVDKVKKVTQDAEVPLRKNAGQQQHGRPPVLLGGELLGFEQGLVQLRWQDGLGQVSEELLHQPGNVAGQGGGQALLARIQLGLNQGETEHHRKWTATVF